MSSLQIKTYIVLERLNVPDVNGDNVRVLDVFLTSSDADDLVGKRPGTFVAKRVATKSPRGNPRA